MSIIEKMVSQLNENRQSMTRQIHLINEISDQSNNLILQMEAQHTKECEAVQDSSYMKCYCYNKELEHGLSKSIEIYERLSRGKMQENIDEKMYGFAEFLQQKKQSNQHLSNNLRKTLVIGDIMERVTADDADKEDVKI